MDKKAELLPSVPAWPLDPFISIMSPRKLFF